MKQEGLARFLDMNSSFVIRQFGYAWDITTAHFFYVGRYYYYEVSDDLN